MENKFIPSIETEIRKLKSLLVSFIIVCLLMGAVALIRGESLEISLYFSGYIFLIALFLFCLWVIYTVIRATISRIRRRTIIKKGGRVEGVVRKVIWERSYRGVKKGVRWVIEYQNPKMKEWKSPLYPSDLAPVLEPECGCVLYVRGRSVCLAEEQPEELVRGRWLKYMKEHEKEIVKARHDKMKWFEEMTGLPQIKEGSVPKVKYSIESFPGLSTDEKKEMDKEWRSTAYFITDSFFRFLPFPSFNNQEILFWVYVEIRYENGRPDEGTLLLAEENLYQKLNVVAAVHDLKGEKPITYIHIVQAQMQQEIRQLMAQYMPDLVITDVFVEPILN